MNVRKTTVLRSTPLALAIAVLAGCGDSDLPEHHRELLAEAAQTSGATSVVDPDATGSGSTEPGLGEASEAGGGDAPVEPITAAPTTSEPEPATSEPEPATSEPEPTTSEPEPQTPAPQPSEPAAPEPAAPEPTGTPGEQGPDGASEPDGSTDPGTDAEPDTSGGEPAPEAAAPPPPAPATPGSADGGAPSTDGAPVEAIDLDDYTLVFADEFDGDALDPARWKTAFEYGQVAVEEELQYYVDTLGVDEGFAYDPFTVAGGTLTIRAVETPDELRADANGQGWLSGVLSTAGCGTASDCTAGRFDFEQGYAEIRVDLPDGAGLGSLFTLIASDYATPPRPLVNVMRHDGGDADELQHEYRFTDPDGQRRSPGAWTVADDTLPAGFHTVGVSWDDEGLLWFVDGEATYRVVGDSLPAQALYLVANLAVGGTSRSEPDAATPRPGELVIDHVRVWQRNP